MTNEEALTIIARLVSAWPGTRVEDPTVRIWVEHLLPKRADLALEAVIMLEQGADWFPALAEFNREYHREAEYDRISRASDRGLTVAVPDWITDADRVRAYFEEVRAQLPEKQAPAEHARVAVRSDVGLPERPLTYDEVYGPDEEAQQ